MRLAQLVLCLTILVLAFANATTAWADFEAGRRAYIQKNYPFALRTLVPLAEAGDPRAQDLLSTMYAKGLGLRANRAVSLKWLKRAAEQGYAPAQRGLGYRYVKGEDVARDTNKGLALLRAAAEQGNAWAQVWLGIFLTQGNDDVPVDTDEGYKWLLKAAEQRTPFAMGHLARSHAGYGGWATVDLVEALKWALIGQRYDRRGETGSMIKELHPRMSEAEIAEAQRLAEAWMGPVPPAPADFEGAERAYKADDYPVALQGLRPLAEAGDPRAQHLLGRMYFWGTGLQRDESEAIKWLKRAADQGHVPALGTLAAVYVAASAAHRDRKKGAALMRAAAEQGNAEAQASLGLMFLFGVGGLPVDPDKAYQWYLMAAENKYAPVFMDLANFHAQPIGDVRTDNVEALKWALIGQRYANNEGPEDIIDEVRPKMSAADIAKAQRRADAWIDQHPD